MLGYFQSLSSAYSQDCLSGGGRDGGKGRQGGREDKEDSHYTNSDAYRYQIVR